MQTSIVGSPPWFPSLGEVMEPAPGLLDELVAAFAPLVTDADPDVFWTALHCYALDRLMGVVFDGPVDEAWVREAAWVSYATGFWCARSWRGVWVPVDESFSVPTAAESVAALAGEMGSKWPALRTGGRDALDRVAELLRVPTFHGALYGTAYNTSYLIVVGEAPPRGHRPAHLSFEHGYVRADADDLLGLRYEAALPAWLANTRDTYHHVEATEPERFRSVIDGGAGAPHLAALWREGFGLAVQNWGGDFIAGMTQDYYDAFVRWSVLYNFGLEAISRAAIVALAGDDADLALRVLAGNIVFDGSWGSLVLGVLDGTASLPEVVTA